MKNTNPKINDDASDAQSQGSSRASQGGSSILDRIKQKSVQRKKEAALLKKQQNSQASLEVDDDRQSEGAPRKNVDVKKEKKILDDLSQSKKDSRSNRSRQEQIQGTQIE